MEANKPKNPSVLKVLIEVTLIMGVGMYIAAKVQRSVSSPDFGKTLKMRSILGVKRMAQWQADVWTNIALDATTYYNRVR